MYGNVKPRTQHNGSVVGKFAGIVSCRNFVWVQKLTKAYPKLTETGLCNKILNSKLDELRELHERLDTETADSAPVVLDKITKRSKR